MYGDFMNSIKNIVVSDVLNTLIVPWHKGKKNEMENRKSYGLSFCEEGEIIYSHKGKTFVSDNKHIIILPQGESYKLEADKSGAFPLINFSCAEEFTHNFLLFPVDSVKPFMSDFERIQELMLFPENRIKVMSIFYNMLHKLSTDATRCKTISPAIKYIEKNYKDSNLSNEKLACVCNISEVYLRKLFNKHLKRTPKQYISDIRLQKAKQLLTDGCLKINAVAEECGFSNPYHFSRFFKEQTGVAPTEYARENKAYQI